MYRNKFYDSQRIGNTEQNESHHKNTKNKAIIISSNEDKYSSDKSEGFKNRPNQVNTSQQISFVEKVKLHYNFEDERFPRTGQRVQKRFIQHLSDIKQAVKAFNSCGAKPRDFPSDLTRDLLDKYFININLIYASSLARKSCTKIYDSDEKSMSTSSVKTLLVNNFEHWQKIIETLRQAYTSAYRVAASHFNT